MHICSVWADIEVSGPVPAWQNGGDGRSQDIPRGPDGIARNSKLASPAPGADARGRSADSAVAVDLQNGAHRGTRRWNRISHAGCHGEGRVLDNLPTASCGRGADTNYRGAGGG